MLTTIGFVFDFDLTLTRQHTRGIQLKKDCLDPLKNLKNPKKVERFIQQAFQLSHHIAIATLGDIHVKRHLTNPQDFWAGEELVQVYLQALLRNTPQLLHHIEVQAFYAQNKNLHLKNIQTKFPKSTLVLLDDDKSNVQKAQKANFLAVHVTQNNWDTIFNLAYQLILNKIPLKKFIQIGNDMA